MEVSAALAITLACLIPISYVDGLRQFYAIDNPFGDLRLESPSLAVSQKCLNDSQTWTTSLDIFARTAAICETQTCTVEQKKILSDNFYAVKQWDAFGKFPPPGVLDLHLTADGSYSECRDVSGVRYRTNYCYLLIQPGRSAKCNATNPLAGYGKTAVCMPSSCGETDLPQLYNQMTTRAFTACAAVCVIQDVPKTTAFWIFSAFMFIVGVVVLLASVVDYFLANRQEPPAEYQTTNTLLKVFLAFSIYTNAGAMLSVKEPKAGHIRSLDCIRLLSMSWVVAGHTMTDFLTADELGPLIKVPSKLSNMMFVNALYSVDTFFLLSGIVVAYLFFKERPQLSIIKSPITWLLFYFHRYIRLTPSYILFIGFFVVYGPFINGPWSASSFNLLPAEIEDCKMNWWRNLLYINNFREYQNCYVISWYLAVDTQLYLAAPVMLVALYFSLTAGIAVFVAACVISIVVGYVELYKYDLPASNFGPDPNQEFSPKLYNMPWIRCTPYVVGVLVGFFLAKFGRRRIRLNWAFVVGGWLLATTVASLCLFGIYDYYNGGQWSKFTRATYYNFSRLGWALAVAWVVVANHMGWGGPINDFMSHPIWQPFGRLSYSAYIVHWMVLAYFMNLQDRAAHFISLYQVYLYYAIPVTVLAYFFAFFWSCMFEVPILKAEKILLSKLMDSGAPRRVQEAPNPKAVVDVQPSPVDVLPSLAELPIQTEVVYRRNTVESSQNWVPNQNQGQKSKSYSWDIN